MRRKPLLLTPGPVEVSERVLRALSEGIISHRGSEYHEVHCEAVKLLAEVGGLRGGRVYLIPGSGTTAVDAMIYSLVAPGDEALVYSVGEFGERAVKTFEARGARVTVIRGEWGKAVDLGRLEEALERGSYKAVFIVHNETSTGVANRVLREAASLAHKHGAILLVDSVSGFAGERLYMSEWGIDAVATASQKCLAAPPGLGIVLVRGEVVPRIEEVASKAPPPPSINLLLYDRFLDKCETPFTPPVNIVRALLEALREIVKRGVEAQYRIHEERASRFYRVIDDHGLETLAEKSVRSNTVAAVKLPQGIRASDVKRLMVERGFVIAGGMGAYRETVVRLGLMGAVSADEVEEAAHALVDVIRRLRG